jgi:hypothetical protein
MDHGETSEVVVGGPCGTVIKITCTWEPNTGIRWWLYTLAFLIPVRHSGTYYIRIGAELYPGVACHQITHTTVQRIRLA